VVVSVVQCYHITNVSVYDKGETQREGGKEGRHSALIHTHTPILTRAG
jgi:hypothetical protein